MKFRNVPKKFLLNISLTNQVAKQRKYFHKLARLQDLVNLIVRLKEEKRLK